MNINTYKYICMCVYKYMYINIYKLCVCVYKYVFMYVCLFVCLLACMFVGLYVCLREHEKIICWCLPSIVTNLVN